MLPVSVFLRLMGSIDSSECSGALSNHCTGPEDAGPGSPAALVSEMVFPGSIFSGACANIEKYCPMYVWDFYSFLS